MKSREIVRRAIEFENPPRLPFFQHEIPEAPDDVCDIWEMDRAQAGWFFDNAALDDWSCGWAVTGEKNMGQVVDHPLKTQENIDRFHPPDPTNPFYFQRMEPLLDQADGRYVIVTAHFNLIERLHMLRGFAEAMEDFYLNPQQTERLLDIILQFRIEQLEELHTRFGNRIDGIFLTDDWGTQQGPFVGMNIFDQFFAPRYKTLFKAIHGFGWHVFLHSCGKINALVPRLIKAGVDVLNMQQPQAYGLIEFGETFKGKVGFLTTADIQTTLPRGNEQEVREEVRLLIQHWSVPEGGFIVFNYGDPQALGVPPEMTRIMFEEFVTHMNYWR